jgi:hypothetical protein
MAQDLADEVRFFQHHLPGLAAGDYEVVVEQEVTSSKITSQNRFATTRTFSVAGDRFALKPADVAAVFPPAGSFGDHSNVLPHVLLHRSTLPWERRAVSGVHETPWLALLLFYEGEAPTPEVVSLKDLRGGRGKFPLFDKERGQSDNDKVTVIDVRRKTLEGTLPLKDELAILTHVRETGDYVITEQTLAALKAENVPDDVPAKLAGLKDRIFLATDEFLAALKNVLGEQQATQFQETILRHAANRTELAVIIGNRLPRPKGASAAHLVSVEGRYDAMGFNYQDAGEDDYIRLVSLQSWSFACLDHEQSFTGLLKRLNRTPSVLRLPDCDTAAANEYLALGAVPLWHGLRQGGKTVSWYHGPLAPAENPSDTSAPKFPVRTADELTRYSPATGMFDVSYAAAWELGRLLALQSKSFSVTLYNWKRAHAQQLRQIEEELLHISPLDNGSGSESGAIPIPPEVATQFRRLSLLEGLPFNYLIPDERLLPLSSIRFFQLDWLWVECMLDGAFSIGRVTSADHRRDSAHVQRPAANPHAKVSGMLMRSEVVSGWPGLRVKGLDGHTELKLLRMSRLSPNVLLCLFDGGITALELSLRPETAHFGLDPKNGDSSAYSKKLRGPRGDISGQQVDTVPFRQTHPGTLNVSALVEAIKGHVSPLTSAQFALQMIETSESVRFELRA